MSAIPGSYPTTSDIGLFMKALGYEWSNEAQIYFHNAPCGCLPKHRTPQTIDRNTAEHMYKILLGSNPYSPLIRNDAKSKSS